MNMGAIYGRDLVQSYVITYMSFGAVNIDGFGDGGVDVRIGSHTNFFFFQVKNSEQGAAQYMAYAKVHDFRLWPVAVGDPGTARETYQALCYKGLWVGRDVPDRENVIRRLSQLREVSQVSH